MAVPAVAADAARRTDLIRDVPLAGDLAAPANGQTLYVLAESDGSVVAIDPFEPTKRWVAVAAPDKASGVNPVAIASIDTGTLAILCRGEKGWSIRSHRVQPGVTSAPSEAVQTVSVGTAAADADTAQAAPSRGRPAMAVSPSRDWLTVAGIEPPTAPVLRAPIAGARIGAVSTRSAPQLPAGVRPVAVTVSAADEFVLFCTDPATGETASVFLSFFRPPHPRRLLHIDTGLVRIHDAAFCRGDGTLWVVGGDPGGSATSPEGLWRIDAVLRQGRQEALATLVARLDGAVSLACLSERAIVVTHGRPSRLVSRIDPLHDASPESDTTNGEKPSGGTP